MNRTKALVIGSVVGVIVLVGAAWGASQLYAQYTMKRVTERVQRENPGTVVKYGSYYFQPFGFKWILKDVVVENNIKQLNVHIKKVSVNALCDLKSSITRGCTSELEGMSFSGKDPEIQEMLTKYQEKLGSPLSIDMKVTQSYQPKKNFASETDIVLSQKDIFKFALYTSFEGLDLEALTDSLKATLAQGDISQNAGAMMFMYASMVGNTQVHAIKFDIQMEKKLAELVKSLSAENPQYTFKNDFPELEAFFVDPKSFKLSVQPVKDRTLSALLSDERAQYGVRGWVELLGAQMSVNDKNVDLVALLDSDKAKTAAGLKPAGDKSELKIKRTIAE